MSPMDGDQLRQLLSDAVRDIEPTDHIDRLRAQVRPSPKVVPMARSRSWYAAAGIVTTAAVIGVVAYLTSVAGDRSTDVGPASGAGTALPTVVATDTSAPQPSSEATSQQRPIVVYYLGHSPRGDVLFGQATPVSTALTPLRAAVTRLMADPYDPDYRLGWSPGWLTSAELSDGVIRVELGTVPAQRPARMSPRTAYEVVQSAVYTLRSASRTRADVQFLRSGSPASTVLGVPTDQPLGPGRPADVLSHVELTRPPVDGLHRHTGRLVVTGTADGALDGVVVRLVRTARGHQQTVSRSSGLSSGVADQDGRYRWRVLLDTASLTPGSYTVLARNEGRRDTADTDTRVVVLR
jgi:hypothetical protein